MTDSKKPTAGFWITVALVAVLVGYPLSFGPACWITSRTNLNGKWITIPYRPIICLWDVGPEPVGDLIVWYSGIAASDDWGWTLHIDLSKNTHEVEWGPL